MCFIGGIGDIQLLFIKTEYDTREKGGVVQFFYVIAFYPMGNYIKIIF